MITKEEFITASEAKDLLVPNGDILFEKYPDVMQSISEAIREASIAGKDYLTLSLEESGFDPADREAISEFLEEKGYSIDAIMNGFVILKIIGRIFVVEGKKAILRRKMDG